AVVGQDEDYLRTRLGDGVRNWVVRRQTLPPMRPRLQPEYLASDIAPLRGSEQRAGDRRIGLRHTAIKLTTEARAQRLWRAADEFGDVVLTAAETSQISHLLTHRVSHDKCFSRHLRLLIDRGLALRHAR